MYTVYQHIFPNGKRYIGVTRNSVEKRWGYKGYNYKSQVVGRAIEKYGWDNIEHDVFAVCETKEQAERIERWLVKYYDTTNPMCGYNVLPGGDVAVNDATPEMRYKLGYWYFGGHKFTTVAPSPAFYYAYEYMVQNLPQIAKDVLEH